MSNLADDMEASEIQLEFVFRVSNSWVILVLQISCFGEDLNPEEIQGESRGCECLIQPAIPRVDSRASKRSLHQCWRARRGRKGEGGISLRSSTKKCCQPSSAKSDAPDRWHRGGFATNPARGREGAVFSTGDPLSAIRTSSFPPCSRRPTSGRGCPVVCAKE